MSVLFTDSCDGYSAVADLPSRWWAAATSTSYPRASPVSGGGRFGVGSSGLRVGGGTWTPNMVVLAQYITLVEGGTTFLSLALNLESTYSSDVVLFGFGNSYFNPSQAISSQTGTTFDIDDYPTYMNIVMTPAGQLRVRRGTTVLATSTESLPIGAWAWLEVAIKVDTAANGGKVHIRLDGADFLIFDGDTYVAGSKAVGVVAFWALNSAAYSVDDIIIHTDQGEAPTTFIGDVRIALLMPNADGDASDSTPSAGSRWDAVNDAIPDGDSTYVQATTPGAKDLYQFQNFSIPPESVVAVAVTLAARATGTSNRQIKIKAKAGGVEDESPSKVITPGTYRDLQHTFSVNPATGLPWTPSELDAAQFGWEVAV